jgi:GNAT superfamily N-acetyltransferase
MHMIEIGKPGPPDRDRWKTLFEGYNAFYGRTLPPQAYRRAWRSFQQDTLLHALGAWDEGELVGIAHFLVHPSTTAADVCYLQDLFTAPSARGRGVGSSLIAAVSNWARTRGCSRLYWSTHRDNASARALYDRLAVHRGFIRYDIDLTGGAAPAEAPEVPRGPARRRRDPGVR